MEIFRYFVHYRYPASPFWGWYGREIHGITIVELERPILDDDDLHGPLRKAITAVVRGSSTKKYPQIEDILIDVVVPWGYANSKHYSRWEKRNRE